MTIQRQTHFTTFPRYVTRGYALEAVFPADQRAHVHAYYLHKRNVSAALCAEAVRVEARRMIEVIRGTIS